MRFIKYFNLRRTNRRQAYSIETETGEWNIPELKRLLEELLPKHSALKDFEPEHHGPEYVGTENDVAQRA